MNVPLGLIDVVDESIDKPIAIDDVGVIPTKRASAFDCTGQAEQVEMGWIDLAVYRRVRLERGQPLGRLDKLCSPRVRADAPPAEKLTAKAAVKHESWDRLE